MSRSRWAVLLGPPLILVLAAGAGSAAAGRAARVGAPTLPTPRPVTACRAAAEHLEAAPFRPARPAPGPWWRTAPILDHGGALTGWTLSAGDDAGHRSRLDLPVASAVSGPDHGRLVVAIDDGSRSVLRIVDVPAGCVRDIGLGEPVARRAIFDPAAPGEGFLVHLLARATRADLGVWRVAPDGGRTRVLAPLAVATLRAAGIGRVWTTDLAVDRAGRRLAVQSCDPDACVTRIVERGPGTVTILLGDQGDLVGFAGDRVITMDNCHGGPCGVRAWASDGASRAIATDASSAAVTPDGMVVVAASRGTAGATAIAIDPITGARHAIGDLDPDEVLLRTGAASAGIDAGPDGVGLFRVDGPPAALAVSR